MARMVPGVVIDLIEEQNSFTTQFDHSQGHKVCVSLEYSHKQSPVKAAASLLHDTVLTSGNDFYDDGYNEVELETELPHTLFAASGTDGDTKDDFFGREKELQTLHQVFDRMMHHSKSRGTSKATRAKEAATLASSSSEVAADGAFLPAVFVWGSSGSGKSKLVDVFCDQVMDRRRKKDRAGVRVLKGKFEENQQGNPFSAITQALSDWCKEMATSKDGGNVDAIKSNGRRTPATISELQRLRSIIKTGSLTTEQVDLLHTFVPALSILMSEDDNDATSIASSFRQPKQQQQSQSQPAHISNTDKSWNRFQYTFIQFLTLISSKQCPMVLVLDDLQWASQECMDLMSTAIHQSHFLLIGTIRQVPNPHLSDEVLELEPHLPFAKFHADMEERSATAAISGTATSPSNENGSTNNRGNGNTTKDDPASDPAGDEPSTPFVNIDLRNFTRQEMREWVSHLFQQDDDVVDDTVEVLYRQSEGNIFYSVQLLQDMERTKALAYSRITFQWELNTSMMGSHQRSGHAVRELDHTSRKRSSDVIMLISSKLRALPVSLQRALVLASYIRSSFELDLLQAVWNNEQRSNVPDNEILGGNSNHDADNIININNDDDDSKTPLAGWLEQAVLEGLLANSIGGTTYRFAHDRIQQAAHDLVPFGETRTKLRLRIGQCLWDLCMGTVPNKLSESTPPGQRTDTQTHPSDGIVIANDSGLLFIAAEHLNCIPSKDHLMSAQRNLQVGEHALQMAALIPAATYLQQANMSLRKTRGDPWHEHYDLTLRLMRARCDIELSLNRFDLGYSLGDDLLEHAKSIHDKLPTYAVMSNALGKQDEHMKSLQLSQQGARLCGVCPTRWLTFHAASQLLSTRAYFRRTTDEEFMRQNHVTTNPQTVLSMNFLRQIIVRAFACRDIVTWILMPLQMIRITRRDGICEHLASALVAFAMVHVALGECDNAHRYAKLAKKVLHAVGGSTKIGGWNYYSIAIYIESYSKSFPEVSQDLQYAHTSAMAVGDFELGILCQNGNLLSAFFEGYPLPGIVSASDSLLEHMEMYKIEAWQGTVSELSNTYKCMRGALEWEWEQLMNLDKCEQYDAFARGCAYWGRLHIAVYFGKYEDAETLHHLLLTSGPPDPGYSSTTSFAMLSGLMAANRYRQTRKRKYVKLLHQKKRELKNICNTKGKQASRRYLILRAEWKAIKIGTKQPGLVASCYNEAINSAEDGNHLDEAGLACEMAGRYFLEVHDKDPKRSGDILSNRRFTQALGFYETWGSIPKCKSFREMYAKYIDEDEVQAIKKKNALPVQANPSVLWNQSQSQDNQSSINYDLMSEHTPANMLTKPASGIVSGDNAERTCMSEGAGTGSNGNSKSCNGNNTRSGEDRVVDDILSVLTDMS